MKKNKIHLHWPELQMSLQAYLLEEQWAELKEVFLKSLPMSSIQSHAVVAGRQMYFPVRLLLPQAAEAKFYWEPMDKQPIGRINLEHVFQYLAINYEQPTEPVPALPLAQVVAEDVDTLLRIGEKVWHNLLFEPGRFLRVHVQRGES
ncbi:MAG: hypothetical protein AB1796_02690 [Bacillota bacterium]